jgi:hypothetical protein
MPAVGTLGGVTAVGAAVGESAHAARAAVNAARASARAARVAETGEETVWRLRTLLDSIEV